MDEFNNQAQDSQTVPAAGGTNRRHFLKVAVISSAAAAATAGGVGVAAAALESHPSSGLSKLLVLGSSVISTTNACFTQTDTDLDDNSPTNEYAKNEEMFFFAWFTITASGSYTLDFPGGMPTWFNYSASSHPVWVFQNLTGCPSSQPSNPIETALTLPFIFTVGSGVTSLLVQLDLKANNVPAGTQTLTLELKGPSSYDTTATATAYFKN